MAEQYGFDAGQVNGLTWMQLAIYLGAITPEHGTVKMSFDQAVSYLGRRKLKEMGLA